MISRISILQGPVIDQNDEWIYVKQVIATTDIVFGHVKGSETPRISAFLEEGLDKVDRPT